MQPKIQTSAGMETANETVARISAALAAAKSGSTNSGTGTPPPNKPTGYDNALISVLADRLLKQGQGISSSASSNLQSTIEESISGLSAAGDATRARLQSERQREVGFAQDRASATITTALEGRSGYATQVAGLRELTETTEKSIRDLDARYQEAILANDAETAKSIADLKIKKLEFQMQQEQNFYSNMFSLANLNQQAIGQQMQGEQFWADQGRQEREFAQRMSQSDYQFEKSLGIQYKELDLRSQELEIARERNQISWAEYKLKANEMDNEKSAVTTKGFIYERLLGAKKAGENLDETDKLALAGSLYAEMLQYNPNFKMDFEKFNTLVDSAIGDVSGTPVEPAMETVREGGVFGGASSLFGMMNYGGLFNNVADFYFGKETQRPINQ